MAVRWAALSPSYTLLPRNIIFLLLALISVRGFVNPSVQCGRKDYVNRKKNSFTSLGLKLATFCFVV
jgi:hypothetical protein